MTLLESQSNSETLPLVRTVITDGFRQQDEIGQCGCSPGFLTSTSARYLILLVAVGSSVSLLLRSWPVDPPHLSSEQLSMTNPASAMFDSVLLLEKWDSVNADELPLPFEGSADPFADDDETQFAPPRAEKRCNWVIDIFQERYKHVREDELSAQYAAQSANANTFYRATADIFWLDYTNNLWGNYSFEDLGIDARLYDGTPVEPKSTWTWVTGDQHLSNFGAWRNRGGELVFGVNDFDEAAIFDFQIDVLRIAVSVCNHAFTNGLTEGQVKHVLNAFTDTYVETVMNYVGNEKAMLYELTPSTATGSLKTFLENVQDDDSPEKQLLKFTEVDKEGNRRFIKSERTRLVAVSPKLEEEIREAFQDTKYGATRMKVGWHVRHWDDDYFKVLDVAARVGSGIGSYGVERFYVLLNGEDRLLTKDCDGFAIILDVKYEPKGAVSRVLNDHDSAWYHVMFPNDAARAVEGQRRLTSYTDPFLGWVEIGGKAFVVRQRSPWKASPALDSLTDAALFIDFMEQIAVSTATSHARGTVAKSPGQFKEVISSVLGKWSNRRKWGKAISRWARHYREQVLMDYECFKDFVDRNYR